MTTMNRSVSLPSGALRHVLAFDARGKRLALLLGAALLTGCASARGGTRAGMSPLAELRRAADSLVSDPMFRSATWGILIVDPERGDTLYAHNAGRLIIPASNQKILTGAVALRHLGPEFRYVTTYSSTGTIDYGVLRGDLVVTGSGDPTVSDRMAGDAMVPLRAVAESLAARGITRIAGGIVRGGDAFPGSPLGYGWTWSGLDSPSYAGVDELNFNEGVTRLVVRGGRAVGDTPTVSSLPAKTFPRVRILARTSAAGAATVPRRFGRGGVRARPDSSNPADLILEGEIAVGDSVAISITQRDPSAAYLSALREALGERGITVDGPVSSFAPVTGPTPLFTTASPPLRDILGMFLKPSQNAIGEILLRTLGSVKTGVGSPDSGARVIRSQLLEWGALPDGFVVRDGSGLSRSDVVTPETLVKIFAAMRSDTAFRVFYDALPIAGVDGTIRGRMRDTPAMGNVHAKTGTLDMVRSLSGYVTTADDRLLIFSMIANNWTVSVREVERVQDAIAVRLAQMRLGRN
jgi:D-alanyl-D-alanine carboxypeptidase/D-alanyl-D-alanine-endopeptidase (penicillin-binding protein 4)